MASVYRELFVLLGFVLVFAICADNATTAAPAAATTAAPAPTAAVTAATGTMTDLAQFVLKFPFSIWSLCKYGADTLRDISTSVITPNAG